MLKKNDKPKKASSGFLATKVLHDAVERALDRHARHADAVIAKLLANGHQLSDVEVRADATNLTRWKILSGGKVVTVLELKLPAVRE